MSGYTQPHKLRTKYCMIYEDTLRRLWRVGLLVYDVNGGLMNGKGSMSGHLRAWTTAGRPLGEIIYYSTCVRGTGILMLVGSSNI